MGAKCPEKARDFTARGVILSKVVIQFIKQHPFGVLFFVEEGRVRELSGVCELKK